MTEETNAVATTGTKAVAQPTKQTIRSLIEGDEFKKQVALALPKHLTPDRFIRVAINAMMRTPTLAQCDHASFFNCLLNLSALGLEPDGRRAHLIPYWNSKRNIHEAQLIVDYKGLVELAMRTGKVSNIHADVVCENDLFEYDMGEIKRHKVNFREPRGDMYAAYCVIRFKDGTSKAEVMSKDEVESIRKRSRAGNSGPWVTDFNEMAKKTVFRRASKWIELSPELRDAFEKDDDRIPDSFAPVAPVRIQPVRLELPSVPEVVPGQTVELPSELEHGADPDLSAAPDAAPDETATAEREKLIDDVRSACVGLPKRLSKCCKAVGIDEANMDTAPIEALRKVMVLVNKEEVRP